MKLNSKINGSDTNLLIGPVRFSYCNVFEPRKNDDGTDGKYQVSVIIPKSDTEAIDLIKSAIEAAKAQGKTTKWDGKLPGGLKIALRDGDEERPDDPAYEDSMFFNASSNKKPEVIVYRRRVPVLTDDPEDFYSGCYGAIAVNFYPFAVGGSKGIAAGMNSVSKLHNGPRLAGGPSGMETFSELDLEGLDIDDEDEFDPALM